MCKWIHIYSSLFLLVLRGAMQTHADIIAPYAPYDMMRAYVAPAISISGISNIHVNVPMANDMNDEMAPSLP